MEPEQQADLISTHSDQSLDEDLFYEVRAMIPRLYRGLNSGNDCTWGPRSDVALAEVLRQHPGRTSAEWRAALLALGSHLKKRGGERQAPLGWLKRLPEFLPASGSAEAHASDPASSPTATEKQTG